MNKVKSKKPIDARSRIFIIAAVCALVVIAAVVTLVVGTAYSKSYIAIVGNEKITPAEFKYFFKQQKDSMLAIAGSPDSADFWAAEIKGEKTIDIARRKALDSAKEFKIYLIKAKEAGLALDQADKEQVQKYYDGILQDRSNDKSQANKYTTAVYGIDLDEYRQILTEYLLMKKLLDGELGKITVNDVESRKRYDEDPVSFDRVTVRHILYLTIDLNTLEQLSEEERKEAGQKADDMLARVKAGEDMESLAVQYSEDPAAKEEKGIVAFDKFDKDEVEQAYGEEFTGWAMDAAAGDAAVIESSYGLHVIKLEKRESPAYEDIKAKIVDEIKGEMFKSVIEEWIKDPKYATRINYPVYNAFM